MPASAYEQLEVRFRRIAALGEAEAVLHWDLATVMPEGGFGARGEQLAELRAVVHAMLTAPEMDDLLSGAEADLHLDDWRRANLREMRARWLRATALSEDLVTALSKAASSCEAAWRDAQPKADFKAVRPTLETLLSLVREAAAAKSERLGLGLYDALLNDYEPGGRAAEIDRVFAALEGFLPELLGEVLERQAARPFVRPRGPFPVDAQRDLGERLMAVLGFDFEHGRLDVSRHPFCGGVPDDVRITTRYDEADFTSSLMAVLHETGHAMYERGLPADWRLQPVGEAMGMSLHESQSLLVEMQICRSRDFLAFAAPIIADALGGSGPAWEAENLYRLYTHVERGFTRVDADEVTYPLHVILRYRLEKAMIEGDMEAADLPAAWNEGFEKLLGVAVPDDRLGCLQDLHWYDGAWGYFPTYTLGAMAAAQLYAAARDQDPDIVPAIRRGDFAPLIAWLGEHVHGKGRLLESHDLLTAATGRPLDPAVFEAHLRDRYLG